jgi:hypothetical protein
MPVSDGKGGILPPIDPAEEIKKHVQSVAERHAARHKARASVIEPLVRRKGVVQDVGVADAPTAT